MQQWDRDNTGIVLLSQRISPKRSVVEKSGKDKSYSSSRVISKEINDFSAKCMGTIENQLHSP
jgi:hypothetical protein